MLCRSLLLALFLVPAVALAQPKGPTEAEVKADLDKFKTERAEAVKKFSADSLTRADDTAKKADAALKDGGLKDAARLAREARWQLPYVPTDLPENVERVLGVNRMRHKDKAIKVAFAPDGNRLASASDDGTVRVWNLGNGREVRAYRAKGKARGLAWAPSGKLVATAFGPDIHVWNPDTGEVVHTLKGHDGDVEALAFGHDSKQLASGGSDTSIRLWNVESGKQEMILNDDYKVDKESYKAVLSVSFGAEGKLVLSSDAGGNVRVWDPAKASEKRIVRGIEAHRRDKTFVALFGTDTRSIFTVGADANAIQHAGYDPSGSEITASPKRFDQKAGGHQDPVTALALTADAKYMVTGSSDTTLRVWDVAGQKVIRVLTGHTGPVNAVAISPDAKTIASVGDDQSVKVWALAVADDHDAFTEHTREVWSAAISPDGKLVASGGADRVVVIREARGGKVLHKLEGHSAAITAVAFSPTGEYVASVAGDKLVKLWDPKAGKLVRDLKGATQPLMAVAFSDDGKKLLAGGIDKTARLYDLTKEDAAPVEFPANRSAVSAVALRKDGKQAAVGAADGQVRFYDLTAAPKEAHSAFGHQSGVGALAYDPDGKRLASGGGDGTVKVWNVTTATPAPEHEFKGHEIKGQPQPVSAVAFGPEGRLLASAGGDAVIRVWDVAEKKEVRSIRGHTEWVTAVQFGPGGMSVVSASVDKTVRVWALASEEAAKGVGHSLPLTAVAVSADGKKVASGSEDKTIRIWSADTGAELVVLGREAGGHRAKVTGLAFDATGKKLISAGQDSQLLIWDLETGKVVRTIPDVHAVPVVVFSTKGDKFAAWSMEKRAENDSVNVLRTFEKDGKPIDALQEKGGGVNCAGFSPDCETAVVGFNDGSVRIWDLGKGQRVGGDWVAFNKGAGDVGITSDRSRVVASDTAGKVKVYDVKDKKEVATFDAFKKVGDAEPQLAGLTLSPTGKHFAVIDTTGEVKAYSTEDGKEVRTWKLPTAANVVTFTADGKKLVTANADATLTILALP